MTALLPGQPFDEERSLSLLLDAPAGEWRDYIVHLDAPGVADLWRQGRQVVRLRLDPIDLPGVIQLGTIELGG